MAKVQFDATSVTPDSGSMAPIPAGWYLMKIDSASMETGKKEEAGEMLKLKFVVDENQHPDIGARGVFVNLCINHEKKQTREIAQRQLSAVCHAIGELQLEDTDQLLGGTLKVKLKVRSASGDYEASNDAAGYASKDDESAKLVSPPKDAPAAEATTDAEAPKAETPKGTAKKRGWKA